MLFCTGSVSVWPPAMVTHDSPQRSSGSGKGPLVVDLPSLSVSSSQFLSSSSLRRMDLLERAKMQKLKDNSAMSMAELDAVQVMTSGPPHLAASRMRPSASSATQPLVR